MLAKEKYGMRGRDTPSGTRIDPVHRADPDGGVDLDGRLIRKGAVDPSTCSCAPSAEHAAGSQIEARGV